VTTTPIILLLITAPPAETGSNQHFILTISRVLPQIQR